MTFNPTMLIIAAQAVGIAAALWLLFKYVSQQKARHMIQIETSNLVLKPIERPHPILGSYMDCETLWWSKITSPHLGYELTLRGDGDIPTTAQLEKWKEIEQRLPALLADIPPPPEDDESDNDFGPFNASEIKAELIHIRQDLSFHVLVLIPRSSASHLSPIIEVRPDWQTSVEWSP